MTSATEPLPSTPASTAPAPVSAPAKRKRRRVWPFVVAVIVVIALIVGAFIADAAVKAYAQDQIKQKVVAALGVDPTTQVDVKIGGGSVLFQALSGKLSTVDITGAKDVPLDQSAPLNKLAITYRVSEKNVSVLASELSGMQLDSVTLKAPEIVANATFKVFGFGIPVGLGLTPSASHGQLDFTPTSILVSGQKFTSKQLLSTPGLGSLAKQLLKQQTFCVAQYLPKALTVTSVKVVGHELVMMISGDGAALGGSAFSTKGSCG